jgi:TonB-linked SusC/RagA family outer membrane protein
MRRFLSLFTMLMLCGVFAFAQTRVVTGKVTDTDGKDIPFATITVKGTQLGVSADASGNYSIKVKTGDVLTITGTGFKDTDVQVGTQTSLLTVLEKSANVGLKEVVITTALNRRVNARSVGTAVSSVNAEDLTKVKAVNIQNGLTGKVAGLNIQSVNSSVFGDTRITLRGIRSLTGNNQPLLVIDGVPVALDLISSISPNDVEDVSVLKSNAAAILYGQDGANGAIVITTKRGTRNKPQVNFSTTAQFDKISFLPKLQNEFGTGETEDANGLPVYDYFTNNSFGPRFDGSMVPLGEHLENGQQFMVPYSNIPGERYRFFNTGVTLQTDLSVSGGDKDSRFLVSVQDAKITGIVPKDKNRRTSFRFNGSRDFAKLTVGFNLNYVLQNYSTVFQNRGGFDDIYTSVIKTGGHVPLTSLKNWRSNPYATADGYYNFFGYNPYMLIDIDRTNGKRHRLIASTDLTYKFSPSLSFTYRLGTTISIQNQKSQQGAINVSAYTSTFKPAPWGTSTKASVFDFSETLTRISSEAYLNYRKSVKKFTVDALVGNSILSRDSKTYNMNGANLVIPTLYNVSNRTGEAGVSERSTQIRTVSAIGQATIGYDNKIFVTLSGRNDWDSRLPVDNNSFFYPGANASLIISDLIPSIKGNALSLLKLKGSIAKSGNVNLDAYSLQNSFSVGAFPYGNLPGYSIDDQLKDPKIKPEFVLSKELGFELAMFRNKVRVEANVYQQDNTDQIIDISVPTSTGYTSSKVNAASFVNKGFEVELGLTPLLNLGKLKIDFKTNYTFQENKVTKVYDGLPQISIQGLAQVVAKEGLPAFALNLIDYNRDPQGRVIVDVNTGVPSLAGARKIYGQTLPKHILGLSPTFTYGDISLSLLFEYRGGNFIYNDIGQDLVFNGIAASTVQYGRQPFVWPNSVVLRNGKYESNTNIYTRSGNANLYTGSAFNAVESAYYTSADFWKLRELAMSYNFPQSVLGTQKVFKAVSVAFIARNIAMWLPKSNQYTDPEFSITTGNATGINTTAQAPPTRSMGVTFNFTF